MDALWSATTILFSSSGLLLLVVGSVLALVLGILPGLSSTEAMIILLPFTFALGLNESMILMCAAYSAAFVGGALTSILFGIPGSSTNLVTQTEGHPLHLQGRTMYAISAASYASILGGICGLVLVIVLLPIIGPISLLFGPPEWFAFVMLGLAVLAFTGEGSVLAGLVAGGLGLLLSTIGLSVTTGFPRFTFGITDLWGGVPIIAAFVGLYPLAEAFGMALDGRKTPEAQETLMPQSRASQKGQLREGLRDTVRHSGSWSIASVVGWVIGVIPGVGGVLANVLGYVVVRESSRDRSRYGKGDVRGLIASEAANNASVGGALVPTLALGIPGSINTAILLGVFMINGVQPGANIFSENLEVTWVILLSSAVATLLGSAIILVAGWRLVSVVAAVPPVVVAPFVIFLGCIAVFLARGNPFDLVFAGAMGIIGLACKRYDFSRISLVIALMLGALVESSYFQTLAIGRGSYAQFFSSPTSLVIWACIALTLVLHLVRLRSTKLQKLSIGAVGRADD